MKKFYVQSGSVSWVLLAPTRADAALRLVQNVMNKSFISGKQPTSSYKLVDQARARELASTLDDKTNVSEQGFDSLPKLLFQTNDLLRKWQQQTSHLERLIRKS